MAVCWSFSPIIWYQGLSNEAQATWFGAVATAVATATAVGIYAAGRWHNHRDLHAKYQIHTMLLVARLRHIDSNFEWITRSINEIRESASFDLFYWFEIDGFARVNSLNRLIGIQSEMTALGIKEPLAIIRFIEFCQIYDDAVSECVRYANAEKAGVWKFADVQEGRKIRLTNLSGCLERMTRQYAAALEITNRILGG